MADPHHPTAAADADASAYVRGEMEINEQVATWSLVQGMFKWGSLGISVLLLFLVLWFMPNGGFLAGFIGAAVLFGAGFVFLKSGKSH